jgi:hypothetical protein
MYGTPRVTPPTLVLLGPTYDASPISTTLVWDGNPTTEFKFTFPILLDGYYQVSTGLSTFEFGVLHSNGLSTTDDIVNFGDVSFFNSNYAPTIFVGPVPHFADFDGNGFVDASDAAILISNYSDDLSAFAPPWTPAPGLSPTTASSSHLMLPNSVEEVFGEADVQVDGPRRRRS